VILAPPPQEADWAERVEKGDWNTLAERYGWIRLTNRKFFELVGTYPWVRPREGLRMAEFTDYLISIGAHPSGRTPGWAYGPTTIPTC
jgi:hypothetical protein